VSAATGPASTAPTTRAFGRRPVEPPPGAPEDNGTFRSLRSRNFRLFFGGQIISQVGNWSTLVVMTLLIYSITDSGFAIGLLAAAQFGPVLLFGPFAGLVADRYPKRTILLVVQSIAMAQSLALAAIAFQPEPDVVAIYLVALVGGFTTAFDNPARRAFVTEMVPVGDINNAVSLNSALMTSSRIIGPFLGGVLISTLGFGWAFLADGLSYVAVLVALTLIRPSELRASPVVARAKGQVREGIRYAHGVPELWIPLVMMAIVGTLAFNFNTVLPVFVTRDRGGTELLFTILLGVVSFGSFTGALATARRRTISIQQVAWCSLGFAAAIGMLAVAPNLAVALPIGVLLGAASIAFMTASTAIVQIRSDPQMRGRILALQSMVFLGSTPIGGPTVGWICDTFGARYGLLVGAAGCVGAGVWGLRKARGSEHYAVGGADAEASVDDAVEDLAGDVDVPRHAPGAPAPASRPAPSPVAANAPLAAGS
jgi:MFS family permease